MKPVCEPNRAAAMAVLRASPPMALKNFSAWEMLPSQKSSTMHSPSVTRSGIRQSSQASNSWSLVGLSQEPRGKRLAHSRRLERLSQKQDTVAAVADVDHVGPQQLGINLRPDTDVAD